MVMMYNSLSWLTRFLILFVVCKLKISVQSVIEHAGTDLVLLLIIVKLMNIYKSQGAHETHSNQIQWLM